MSHMYLIEPKNKLVRSALSVAKNEFQDDPADPGWQAEYDDQQFDKAAVAYGDALSMQNETSLLATTLIAMYRHDAPFTATLCDEHVDRSGALLGRLRNWVKED